MAGKFNPSKVAELLVDCQRSCCICHRFCGVKIETDHIDQDRGDGIENAIPVCFDCHAEIHHYNDKHPRGRKYRPAELRMHKDRWLKTCKTLHRDRRATQGADDTGSLQGLVDELEFSKVVADVTKPGHYGCELLDDQFRSALRHGVLSPLDEELKSTVMDAYRQIRATNKWIAATVVDPTNPAQLLDEVEKAREAIAAAHIALLRATGSGDTE